MIFTTKYWFRRQPHFDISNFCRCSPKVFLLPSMLARKRMWNPKYPICIQMAEGSKCQQGERGGSVENLKEVPGAEQAAILKQSSSKHAHSSSTTLFLFGRTGREKEEWFHHLMLASMDTETEQERDRRTLARCLSRSGMKYVANALEQSRGGLQIRHLFKHYIYVGIMDYMLQFFAFYSKSLSRECTI